MPVAYYNKVRHLTLDDAIHGLISWLIDDNPSIDGPRWEIVEAYGKTFIGAPVRETPTGRAFGQGALGNFATLVSWNQNSLTVGDWIVLRTRTKKGADSNGELECEVYFEWDTTSTLTIFVMPLNNFATGGGVVTPPTFPAGTFGSGAAVVTMTMANVADYYGVADEGMFAIVMDNGSSPQWTYCGELDGANPADLRPYVIWDTPATVNFPFSTTGLWTRLSPVDSSTIVTDSDTTFWKQNTGVGSQIAEDGDFAQRPDTRTMPAGVFFDDTSHTFFSGFLRNVYHGSSNMAYRGLLDSKNLIYFTNFALKTNNTWTGVTMRWDGVTPI